MNASDLHNYQIAAKEHIINNSHCALFMDMGLGKTISTLTAIDFLMYLDLEIDNVLIIAPKRVVETVWDSEVYNWDHVKHLTINKIIGTAKQRRKALAVKADIHLISRDNTAWLCAQYGGSQLPYDMLIIDELSSFKNPKSIRFRALKKAQPSFKRIVGLTGTPAPNGLIDLWSQIYLLDRGERLGKFISTFRENYFRPDKRNGATVYSYKISDENANRIHEQISDICISMKKEDYLELPARIDNNIQVKLPEGVFKQYRDFEKELVLELFSSEGDTKDISVANAAALSNKLLQFANGAVYDEAKNYYTVHEAKIEAVKDIIDSGQGENFLIGWTYRHDMYRLLEALKKYKPRCLDSEKDVYDWNEGNIKVLLMHPASGGHGLNLQFGGHNIIWFGQTWSLELEQQFNARLDRQGQEKPVIINKLIAAGTLDEDVIQAQQRKTKTQNGLMEAVKKRIEKYGKGNIK